MRMTKIIIMVSILALFGRATAQERMDIYKKEALAWIEDNKEDLNEAAQKIWEFAEIALLEYKSSEYLTDMIERHGFKIERGVADMPTAFVASYGSGKPVIGILGEYDALPGLSQRAFTPHKDPLEIGKPGHGCGHNLFSVASMAAAIAMKQVMETHNLQGTVRFYGCPAEEVLVGKVYMAKAGVFDDLDICFDWHPETKNEVPLFTTNALNNFEVTFYGKTAHAAGDPWAGRSALDAVELMNVGVNFLREHVRPTVRIHYVIPDAGLAPNIVPDHAKVWYYVRGKDRQEVEEVYSRVLDIAEGAAKMSNTEHENYLTTGVYNMLVNREVARVLQRNLKFVGVPPFSEEEQMFARQIQKNLEAEELGMHAEINPLEEPEGFISALSTDVADVSWIVPTASLNLAGHPLKTPGHHWAFVTCSGSSLGHKVMRTAAKTIAAAGIETLLDHSIIERAQEEFKEKTEGFAYKSAIPQDQKPRLPVENNE